MALKPVGLCYCRGAPGQETIVVICMTTVDESEGYHSWLTSSILLRHPGAVASFLPCQCRNISMICANAHGCWTVQDLIEPPAQNTSRCLPAVASCWRKLNWPLTMLHNACRTMLDTPGPYLLDVMVPHIEHVLPMIPGGGSFKDIITTGDGSQTY